MAKNGPLSAFVALVSSFKWKTMYGVKALNEIYAFI